MIRHIDAELQSLKDLVLQMGGQVEQALDSACKCVLAFDAAVFEQVRKHEGEINDLQIRVDEACVNMLAKQAPVARDLRMVIAIIRLNTDLERMGDQSINISLAASDYHRSDLEKKLEKKPVPPQIREMVTEVNSIVRWVLDSFARQDLQMAHQVLEQDDVIDRLRDELFSDIKRRMEEGDISVTAGLQLIMIAKNLERLADHATNIAEEVIFLATGHDVRHGNSGAGS